VYQYQAVKEPKVISLDNHLVMAVQMSQGPMWCLTTAVSFCCDLIENFLLCASYRKS